MRQTLYILTLVILFSCGNARQDGNKTAKYALKTELNEVNLTSKDDLKHEPTEQEIDNSINDFQKQTLENEFYNATLYKLTDTIVADFDGDGNMDKAFFVKENETSGIIINRGLINKEKRIGFGDKFAHLTDFHWVDFWGLVMDSITYEILFDETGIIGDTIIGLDYPSIVLRKEEVGGGLITYEKGEFKWVHQSD